jgi:hypothetical protein
MWAVLLSLGAASLAGLLVGGGTTLWLALVVGLAVFGDQPSDPLTALVASAAVLASINVPRAKSGRRPRGR